MGGRNIGYEVYDEDRALAISMLRKEILARRNIEAAGLLKIEDIWEKLHAS
jgi:hypothetical protein